MGAIRQFAELPAVGPLALGLDVGSVSLDLAVTDLQGRLLADRYERTLGRPVECARDVLGELFSRVEPRRFAVVGGTGSAGRLICELLGVPFVNELVCQAIAIKRLTPEVRTLIEMGGQDSKMLFLPAGDGADQPIVDFAMNTNCAAGTGSFLDQQASRLGLDIEGEFGELALRSKNPPRVAGRCSVFAKSDMIHLQQLATPDYDIVAGLCLGLARNLKSNLSRGHEILKPIGFAGGVAANKGVVRALETVFELAPGELVVHDCHATSGAYGAALVRLARNGQPQPVLRPLDDRREADEDRCEQDAIPHQTEAAMAEHSRRGPTDPHAPAVTIEVQRLSDYLNRQRSIGHRLEPLGEPSGGEPDSRVWLSELLTAGRGEKIDAYLGLDVGSISTKIAVIDEQDRVLGKCYLMTAGRPLEAVRKCLAEVGRQVAEHVTIRGAATTGSGRYLTGDFIGADLVINEITAQAHAAALIDPAVDTIFEIGGQDSKYISLDDGVVVDFEMNHACAAGTGSFLEEQAERLGIQIKEQFAALAIASHAPIRLGERCTVFMESDLLSYQQQGAGTEDLVAGLSYSIVANYINRVVGHRRIGQRIFFQGGTAFNRAVVSAFEKFTGKPVTVPPHHEVTGSIGAAALARKYQQEHARTESNFRGFDLSNIDYRVRSFECDACPNHCEINEVVIAGREPLYYGSRCDRYNVKKAADPTAAIPDLFAERNRLLHKHAHVAPPREGRPTVGIPLALAHYQLLPFWATLLRGLGVNVVVSPASNRRIIHEGVEAVAATPCFPVKVAHGHVLELIRREVDYVWLPSVVSMPSEFPETERNQLCPYVQTIPYQVATALEPGRRGVKLLKPVVRFQDGPRMLTECLRPVAEEFGADTARLRRALRAARAAQRAFEKACLRRGREVLDTLDPSRRNVVIVSRPYNGCDPGVSLDLPKKLRRLGVLPIPMDYLDLGDEDLGEDRLFGNMFWKYGQKILRAGKVIREHPNLYAVYLSNFSCGPDSFIIGFFKKIMGAKPCLVLEIDEHSADAGVVTRLEAFLESLSNADADRHTSRYEPVLPRGWGATHGQRTIYVPYMGDASYVLAAAFRGCGQACEVLPLADEQSLELGRRHTTGKECLPCIVTTGDMVKKALAPGFDPDRAAFFMPGGSGPCRFGQYNCLHRLVLRDLGMPDVPVMAPTQDKRFYDDFKQFSADPTRLAWVGIAGVDVMMKILLALRPHEVKPGEVNTVYRRWLDRLCSAVERRDSERQLAELMAAAAAEFAAVPLDRSRPRPRIGIVGEIYVRSHEFSNNHLIDQLEAIGAETSLASFGEWMYYTNHVRKRTAKRERSWSAFFANAAKDHVQRTIHRRMARPFESFGIELVESPIEHLFELARPYIHDSFEGEAVLSVGKIIEFCHTGCDGVVNVMPFTCMPSTIVSGLTRKVAEDVGDLPILSISYDGQQDPTLQTRLEAFVFQADAFRRRRARQPLADRA